MSHSPAYPVFLRIQPITEPNGYIGLSAGNDLIYYTIKEWLNYRKEHFP